MPSSLSTHRQGQVALITGASQGIGWAIAQALASMGIHLVLCARNTQKLEQLSQAIQKRSPQVQTLCLPCDVQDAAQVEAAVQVAYQHFQRIDILINNAGVAPSTGLLQEISVADIDRTIDTNLKGAIYCMRQVIPHMVQQQSGTIININSIAGKTAYPYWSIYDASKFGLRAITEAVAEEQKNNGIQVVGIYPGAVDTPIWDGLGVEEVPNRTGMLQAEQIAEAVVYALRQPAHVLIKELTITPLQPVV